MRSSTWLTVNVLLTKRKEGRKVRKKEDRGEGEHIKGWKEQNLSYENTLITAFGEGLA